MQRPQESNQDNVNGNSPTILEENAEEEAVISTKGGPDLADMELAHDGKSATIKDREEETQNVVVEESKTAEVEMSILGGAEMKKYPPDTEMRISAVNKVPHARSSDKEVEVPQALSSLDAEVRILKNGDVLSVQGRDVSQIEGAEEIRELSRAFSGNAPQSEKAKKIIDRNEFMEEWAEGLKEWNIEDKISEESVGDHHAMDNQEADRVNNDIEEI